jgi:Domain of unknown function (DUF5753)
MDVTLFTEEVKRVGLANLVGPWTPERFEETSEFLVYEHNVIPGPLQLPEYHLAMLDNWVRILGLSSDQAKAELAKAQDPQHGKRHYIGAPGKAWHIIIEEQALYTLVGDSSSQVRQLDTLLSLHSVPGVSFGIVPLGAQRFVLPSTPFWVFDRRLVAAETPSAFLAESGPEQVKLYLEAFRKVGESSLYGQRTVGLVAKAKAAFMYQEQLG